ncbi:hypothetical protein BCR44DRAFT_39078 [Catenaria anguillulae PL171]|uniref:Uncharacterized protein n=1 Tax=Catenaria anguillulae PL171 TaxID=765915 RepID=A0A1Y2I569_9FUNG|nr:hypothetical protein BCR44DRAFT_39078 [Catenaria anguillulae PL171]
MVRRRTFRTRRPQDWRVNAAVGICLVVCAGPILLIAGGYMLATANEPTREVMVQQYTSALEQWKQVVAANFTAVQFSISTSLSGNATGVNSVQRMERALFSSKPEETFTTKEPTLGLPSPILRYVAEIPFANDIGIVNWTMPLSQPTGGSAAFTWGQIENVTRGLAPRTFNYTRTSTELGCRTSACTQSDSSDRRKCEERPLCSNACPERGGTWVSTTRVCRFTAHIQAICMMFSESENRIVLQRCFYETSGIQPSTGAYPIATYGNFRPSAYTVEIRNVKDPIILASMLTQGDYWFGLSMEQKRAIGISLLAGGGGYFGLICCCFAGFVAVKRGISCPRFGPKPVNPAVQPLHQVQATAVVAIEPTSNTITAEAAYTSAAPSPLAPLVAPSPTPSGRTESAVPLLLLSPTPAQVAPSSMAPAGVESQEVSFANEKKSEKHKEKTSSGGPNLPGSTASYHPVTAATSAGSSAEPVAFGSLAMPTPLNPLPVVSPSPSSRRLGAFDMEVPPSEPSHCYPGMTQSVVASYYLPGPSGYATALSPVTRPDGASGDAQMLFETAVNNQTSDMPPPPYSATRPLEFPTRPPETQ